MSTACAGEVSIADAAMKTNNVISLLPLLGWNVFRSWFNKDRQR
jgi:hypothetical protein